MKNLFISLNFVLIAGWISAQSPIGHTTITFADASRTGGFGSGGGAGRQIQSEIYYPATVAGNNSPVASGNFPVVVFGHGFVMAWDAYQNIWEELVPQGYILVFPRTEGNFSPSHQEFALDLNYCVGQMQLLNANSGSIFFNKVSSKSALMGHSMGGGAAILGASQSTSIETVVGLAPAETNPSAIAAAGSVQVSSLIMSGSSDGVTPPADHHLPIYNGISANCKYFLNIIGGAHCYFANTNFNCDFGESTSSTGISISRPDQHQVTFDYISKWLAYKLKNDCAAFSQFNAMMGNDTRITTMESCNLTGPTITAAGATTICSGESVQLNASSAVSWSNGASGPSISVNANGIYEAYDPLTCAASNSISVTVNPNPIVTVTANNAVLQANQVGANYQWLDCGLGNQEINGAISNTFTANQVGNYAVEIDLNGCVDTSACVQVTTVSVEMNPFNKFAIYPNPSAGQLTFESMIDVDFSIVDLKGVVVEKFNLGQGATTVNLSLAKGIYVWKAISSGGDQLSGRLVID